MIHRVAVFVALLAASWCVMAFVHESGHLLCGWIGGGEVQEADLAPWGLPYSRFEPDPRPLLTLWGGPVVVAMLPSVAAAIAWISGERFLDTPRILHHGSHPAAIAAFCVVTMAAGHYGFREECIRLLSAEKKLHPGGPSHAEAADAMDSR